MQCTYVLGHVVVGFTLGSALFTGYEVASIDAACPDWIDKNSTSKRFGFGAAIGATMWVPNTVFPIVQRTTHLYDIIWGYNAKRNGVKIGEYLFYSKK